MFNHIPFGLLSRLALRERDMVRGSGYPEPRSQCELPTMQGYARYTDIVKRRKASIHAYSVAAACTQGGHRSGMKNVASVLHMRLISIATTAPVRKGYRSQNPRVFHDKVVQQMKYVRQGIVLSGHLSVFRVYPYSIGFHQGLRGYRLIQVFLTPRQNSSPQPTDRIRGVWHR